MKKIFLIPIILLAFCLNSLQAQEINLSIAEDSLISISQWLEISKLETAQQIIEEAKDPEFQKIALNAALHVNFPNPSVYDPNENTALFQKWWVETGYEGLKNGPPMDILLYLIRSILFTT